MTLSALPPELEHELTRLKERVTDLERKLGEFFSQSPTQDICTFPGALFPLPSGDYKPRHARNYHQLVVTLRVAGSTATSLRLLRDGATFSTFTVPAAATDVSFLIDFRVSEGQRVRFQVISGGTGAQDLVAHLRY